MSIIEEALRISSLSREEIADFRPILRNSIIEFRIEMAREMMGCGNVSRSINELLRHLTFQHYQSGTQGLRSRSKRLLSKGEHRVLLPDEEVPVEFVMNDTLR